MRRLGLLLQIIPFIFFFVSCQTTNTHYSPDQTTHPQYFPNKIFDEDGISNDDLIDYYTSVLTTLKEPSLYKFSAETNLHCYRLLVLASFQAPLSLRIMISSNGSGFLAVKMTEGGEDFQGKILKENYTIRLTKKQIDKFLYKLNKARFWDLPSYIDPIKKRVGADGDIYYEIIADGAYWIYEGVKNGTYHVVSNRQPDDDFGDAINYVIHLAGD